MTASRVQLLFTPRGFIIAITALLLSGIIGQQKEDIVASSAGVLLLVLLAISALLTILARLRFDSRFTALLSAKTPETTGLFSRIRSQISVSIPKLPLPPLTKLSITPVPHSDSIETISFVFTGNAEAPQNASTSFEFPHRGDWRFSSIQYTVEDFLGLTKLSWTKIVDDFVSVEPLPVDGTYLPVLSSQVEEGSEIPSTAQALGDPLELKSYHPSDGIRRIFWKAFARSGELLVRHPEKSVRPEGKVLLYGICFSDDDATASLLSAYAENLATADCSFVAAALGVETIATTLPELRTLGRETAFAAEGKNITEATEKILALAAAQNGSSVALFVSCKVALSHKKEIRALCATIEKNQIVPILVIAREYQTSSLQERAQSLITNLYDDSYTVFA